MAGQSQCTIGCDLLSDAIHSVCPVGPAAKVTHMMTNTRELADRILRDISELNPYTHREKHLAFIWATGFLARCCAEMIWRDSRNWDIYTRIRDQASQKAAPLLDKRSK